MASRRAVPPSLWSGHERLRIGERLQASLAGLWELDLLREMQKANVESALAGSESPSEDSNGFREGKLTHPNIAKLDQNKAEPVLGCAEVRCGFYTSSENMELCVHAEDDSDKEGLGLRMMGEETKKVGINGGDTSEMPEADSRPSSGFYETSDMGSLSDSCASVHSDGPGASRCSIGSLPHLPGLRENGFIRPRSTDEAAVRLLDLRLQRLTLTNVTGTDNRRPVSTGDLEFLLGLGSLPLPRPPNFQLLRYKSDLVSRNTNEVYHYPSPLHAVALQSPLFTNGLSQSSSQEELDEMPPKVPRSESPKKDSRELPRVRLDQYMAKLVLRYKCRTAANRTESGYLVGNQKSLSMTSICSSGQVAAQVLGPIPGWKIRRRISTCSHLRSPEGPDGARDSRVLDGLWDFPPFPEISSFQSSTANLVKPSELSVISLSSPQDPSVKFVLNKQSATPDRKIWAAGPQQQITKTETAFRKETSLPRATTGVDKLYKGKHASRELVKTPEKGEKAAERSWLSPRELLRRLSLRRKPSSRPVGRARASSEMNVHAAAGLVCASQLQTNRGKAIKPKWTSVLEISSKSSGRHRAKAGTFLPPVILNRNLAFSSDAPATFCFPEDGQFDLPPRQRARHPGNGCRLSEVEATSAVSLNGDWMFHHQLGDRWLHGSATLDSSDLPPHNFKLRRSRSFKELKKMVSRSFKSSRTAKY
ncbi:dapper homolog 1-like isoform X1 [Crotalus tigris]|uniref:dapper homolog 1-like isoform X1 n=2 Tax=Crotalus tigris TaxID=88082 RepID=UPI00192F786F|nr:dapper homolog 1-like isoform X1 [Crotalus tigris]